MNRPVVVIGLGGHGRVVAAALVAAGKHVIAAVDPAFAGTDARQLPYEVIDDAQLPERYPPEAVELALGIGSTRPCSRDCRRRTVVTRLRAAGYRFTTVRHPFSWISPDAELEEGAQVHAGAVIQPGVRIGSFAIINTRAAVDHDCQIGAFCHVAPGATLSGNVQIGQGSHLGTGCNIIQGLVIGRECLVAAGAMVVRPIADRVSVRGIPARPFSSPSEPIRSPR